MKRLCFLSLLSIFFHTSLFSQLGDFRLEAYSRSKVKRLYQTIPANPSLENGPLKSLFIGKNYRWEWITPVRAPVLNFGSDLGGITVKEEGGGRQTRSLKIEDSRGHKWALRSVRKYPSKAVSPALQETVIEKLVAGGISASYPYAVLSVGSLAQRAGVPYLPNRLVVIPDHPALGSFRDRYKNTLAFLERRTISVNKEAIKSYNTYEIIPELQAFGENKVDQVMVLKARLLDNFIMDFDRHADQWEWVKKDSAGKTFYYPVPKDRDQAFFRLGGLLPKLARLFLPSLGQLQGFRAKAANIKTFNYVAKDFDRSFLHELNEQTWSREIDTFLYAMTDSVIEEAIRRQPAEISFANTEEIGQVLKEKRRYFKEEMLDYYRFLSRMVSIPGTNKMEQFLIAKNNDGTTNVEVRHLDSLGRAGAVIYQRSFTPAVTKEIRLYGLEGSDRFLIQGKHDITFRLIGGPGNDSFAKEGAGGKVIVYDAKFEENTLAGKGLKQKLDDDPMVNEFQRTGFQYPTVVPGFGVELTSEGGPFLGAALRVTSRGFRKEPFAASHFFYLTRALQSPSWHARYESTFMGIAKRTDFLVRSEAFLPTVRTYFFGYGNNTFYRRTKGWEHYLASYQSINVSLQARFTPLSWLQLSAGPLLQYQQLVAERNKGTYIKTYMPQNANGRSLYDGLWYGGAGLQLTLDRRENLVFTTNGMYSNFYARAYRGLSAGSGNFEQVGGNISFFTDFLLKKVLVLATSFGADHNWGDFSFPQAQYLGFRQNLRGFNFQRFAGKARAYNNTELRLNLGVQNFYLFKGPAGLVGFHDTGRVWANGEDSDTWHRGWGGGVWVAPFSQVAVLATLSSSKEEKRRLQFSFGFQF